VSVAPRKRTILIVDDSPEDRVAHRRFLERAEDARYDVLEEELGEAGILACSAKRPDCVLLDYSLPDMMGLEFLQRLTAANGGTPPCAVVVLTGATDEGMAVQALKSGAHDYLVKGRVTREALRIAIDSAIEKAFLQRQVLETQARLRSALDTMLDCFAVLRAMRDANGEVVDFLVDYANDQVCAEAKLDRREVVGRSIVDILPDHRRPELYDEYVRVVETGEAVAQEVVIHDPETPGDYPEVLQAWDVRVTRVDDGVAVAWRDITEHKSAESYVYRLNQILEQRVEERTVALRDSVRELEGFTYTVSHDLRAPLRAIIATSNILLEEAGETLEEDHRALLQRQATNAQRLGVLIDDLLRLARISRQEMRMRPVDVTAAACEVIQELMSHQPNQGLEFIVQPELKVHGDEILVRLALLNLIGNAAKFSPKGGTITIGGYPDGNKVVLYVRDQGIGFDMQYAHKLFAPFERLHRETEFPGTGIGLANVHRIVQRHGGTVWAESTPGRGATFYLTMPLPGRESSPPV